MAQTSILPRLAVLAAVVALALLGQSSVALACHSSADQPCEPDTELASDLDGMTVDEASDDGANYILDVVDSLIALDAFEDLGDVTINSLLRDIDQSIEKPGFARQDHLDVVDDLSHDLPAFLSWLAGQGAPISDSVEEVNDELQSGIVARLENGDAGFLFPYPWIEAAADLVTRRPGAATIQELDKNPAVIRVFLDLPAPGSESGTAPSPGSFEPAATSDADDDVLGSDEGGSLPVVPIGLSVLAIAAVGTAFLRTRSNRGSNTRTGPATPLNDPGLGSGPELNAEFLEKEETLSTNFDTPAPFEPAHAVGPIPEHAASNIRAEVSLPDLLDASRRMTKALDVSDVASIGLAEAKRLVGAEGGVIVRRTDMILMPVACEPPVLFDYEHLSSGSLQRVLETGRSTAAVATDEPALVEMPMAMAAVPIVADGIVSGALMVVRVPSRPFDRTDLDALEMLAPLIGSAFLAAAAHQSANELADIEPMTGLSNRRRLNTDLAGISPTDQVAYVMIDIDHFKNFNDVNGHAAGDEALRRVSSLLAAAVRPSDFVYRYGGEEFCLLLPGATAEDALTVAERARAAVEAAIIPGGENQPAGCVTISVGISDSAFGSPGSLVERADAALYEAKRNGRNQICVET